MLVRGEGEGASAGGQSWGMSQPVEGVAAVGRGALPCSPPRSLSLRLPAEKEAGVRGGWWARLPTSTLRPHCPVSSSLDSTAIGGMTNSVGPTPGAHPVPKRRVAEDSPRSHLFSLRGWEKRISGHGRRRGVLGRPAPGRLRAGPRGACDRAGRELRGGTLVRASTSAPRRGTPRRPSGAMCVTR